MTDQTVAPQRPAPRRNSAGTSTMAYLIFASRWIQAPLYLGLIIAQVVYVYVFGVELWHLVEHVVTDAAHIDSNLIMLSVLGLIDVVMVANLLIMVIIGGYEIFVSRMRLDGHPDEPDWLAHVNANMLKLKLAVAIISISSIHLLKTFIEIGKLSTDGKGLGDTESAILWQVLIHLAFIVSAIALAFIDKMQHSYQLAASHSAEAIALNAPADARIPAENR
ncbi:TIGR00645 family protein [Mycetocola saprophilus]|uniref:TIGR00645 family protein n=1 Tax=Mycetocola saprophilus TaxID=76636 RepID=UPI003BF3DAB9